MSRQSGVVVLTQEYIDIFRNGENPVCYDNRCNHGPYGNKRTLKSGMSVYKRIIRGRSPHLNGAVYYCLDCAKDLNYLDDEE